MENRGYLDRQRAVEYLEAVWGIRKTIKSLEVAATRGGGPSYVKFGRRVLYSPDALDEWVRSRLSKPLRATGVPAAA